MSVIFEIWKQTVPEGVVIRYGQIRRNIKTLQDDGLIPENIERAADAGYGSGAGSNASTQQNDPDYRRRKLPWTSRFKVVPDDVKKVNSTLGHHDIVLVSRIPFSNLESPIDWKEDSLDAARTFVSIASLATLPQSPLPAQTTHGVTSLDLLQEVSEDSIRCNQL